MAKPRHVKVTVILSEEEFARLDAYCRERAYKKSTLISRLIRQFLDLEGFQMRRESPFEKMGRGRYRVGFWVFRFWGPCSRVIAFVCRGAREALSTWACRRVRGHGTQKSNCHPSIKELEESLELAARVVWAVEAGRG